MTVDFSSPSYRAAGSDLTIAISPMGLVELADEEFEVHGPRLNRYAHNWAFYLGHHWSYRREPGEPQLTFNYTRAFSDFITNFCFGRGVNFRSPKETEHIVPALLERVWERDNHKDTLLWEIGNQGSVSGDCFVKVAYEEPYYSGIDQSGLPIPGVIQQFHPGRVRILPLNSSYCFPEFHPHDKTRLLRFKMKYRFWGTTQEGTRQVFTYTELITEQYIEEYINDQLVDARPNPLGTIPVATAPNVMVSGSPWGLSDINDITTLNREYNEKATDVSDIVNYHAAPVTIMKGAKSSQLEKGAKKIWGGLPKDADVFNLELGGGGVEAGLSYLEMIKKAMHELTGVPEGALGDVQPISNTSGVALAIQYQPMMQRYNHKKMTYGRLFERVNELIILTIALKEPISLQWTPEEDEELKSYQQPFLDISDPISFVTVVHWPPPLPVDKTVILNEILLKMQIGIMSKRDALEELGEVFPDEKMRETFLELVEDAINQGALDMLRAQISQYVQSETGQFVPGAPQPFPPPVPGMPSGAGGEGDGAQLTAGGSPTVAPSGLLKPVLSPDTQQLLTELNTRAYGTRIASRRTPASDMDNTT